MDNIASMTSATLNEESQAIRIINLAISLQLKFLMSNMKLIITTQLISNNHVIWKSHIVKLFTVNEFDNYFNGGKLKRAKHVVNELGVGTSNLNYNMWMLIDQNLVATLYSTILASLLSYSLNLNFCNEI